MKKNNGMDTSLRNIQMLGYDIAKQYPDICCFVTTRHGGYSTGNYGSFNCTHYTGDDIGNVVRNQELLRTYLPGNNIQLIIPVQTHSTQILSIDKGWHSIIKEEQDQLLKGVDALITDQKKICLCISTADCVPILLYDSCKKVVGAVHAGWRGTVGKIVTHTLAMMKQQFGTRTEDVIAMIGPSISKEAFEVGDEVVNAFYNEGFPMERIYMKNMITNKGHIDLWEANKYLLEEAGMSPKQIEVSGICTYRNVQDFFSARRLGICSGRILSGIMLL